MVSAPVHKDVYNYEPKVLFILTARTLAFTGAALALGIVVGAICLGALGLSTDVAIYPIMCVALPVFLFGYARPHKMKPEELLPYLLRAVYLPQRLDYAPQGELARDLAASGHYRKPRKTRRPTDAEKRPQGVHRHYARVRRLRGIESVYPAEPLS